jgi:hypothetical protein
LAIRLNALADSDDTTLDQLSEIVAYIKSNKSLIEGITTNKVSVSDIIDNLTTSLANKPLSAAQGVVLKALIDDIVVPTKVSELTNDSGFITSIPSEYVTETELNAKNYLTSIPSEYVTETELNAKKYLTTIPSEYVTDTDLPKVIDTALAQAKASGEFDGEDGVSGVYVGSGDMPEGYNVQIDPNGEVLTVESIAEEVSEIINAEVKTAFIPETTVNFADYGGEYAIESDLKFDAKKTYKVIWDGASYECDVSTVDEDGVILSFIGSKSFLTGENDGIPFVVLTYSDVTGIGVAPATLDEVGNPIVEDRDITFSVFEITERYAKIPVCQFETVTVDGEMFKVLKGASFDYLTKPRTIQIDGVLYNTSYFAKDDCCIVSCMYPKNISDIYTEAITLVHGVIENESVWGYGYKITSKFSGTFVSTDAE